VPPSDPPPDEPLDGLLRKAGPGGDLLARAALGKLQARLFGRAEAPIQVGRYVLEERIGAGGSGVVYRAFDPKHERKVALKLLHAREDGDQAAARARLLREAQVLAKLSHPNVVRILDVGTVDPSVLEPGHDEAAGPHTPAIYLVMELLDGCDLARWLAAEPRGWQAVREVFLAAGRGLAAAHAQGLVHRDFKPANVSIDADGRARVLDFGLARPLPVPAAEVALGPDTFSVRGPSLRMTGDAHQRLAALARPLAATLTAPGTLLGTPAYMAPEQHERQRATARSDQYGFCVSLYEAWYGQRAFLATTEDELRVLARRGDVRPPPADTDVPPQLWPVLRRGLSPQPEDRFESMDALLAALMQPAPQTWRRGRRPVAMAAAVAGALAIGAIAWGLGHRETEANETDEAMPPALEPGDLLPFAEDAARSGHLALEQGDLARAEARLTEAVWSDDPVPPRASLLATIDLLELARRASPRPADGPVWIRLARERAALPAVPPELRAQLYLGLHRLALADGDLARAETDLHQALALPLDEGDAERARRALAEARAREPGAPP